MRFEKPNLFLYRIAQLACGVVGRFGFRPRILRNEIKGKKGPFVVIANHQSSLDFTSLINATHRSMTFVISHAFYNTLPVKGVMRRLGVIPKQQFQTNLQDIHRMRAVLENDGILVIYPAGLMCEDGLSTPLPAATYKFLKWMKADVYVARTSGTYFARPKWSKGFRPGRTFLDIYRLFTKEELAEAEDCAVRKKTDEALLFDAYREQEELRIKYKKGSCIEGLENVLYRCPHCGAEFQMEAKGNRLSCAACGFAEEADEYGFLHKCSDVGEEIRYVSDWSRRIYERAHASLAADGAFSLSTDAKIRMIDYKKHKFVEVGAACVTLTHEGFHLTGNLRGEDVELRIPTTCFASLPFSPGKHFDIQHGKDIFRCYPEDGRRAIAFVHAVKALYEIRECPVC